MISRSIIRLRQVIDLRDTDKSRYFAITELNNCFIIRSSSLFFNEYSGEAKRSAIFTQERSQEGEKHGSLYACAEYYLDGIAHEHTIICRQLFAGHVVGSRPMKRKKHLHRMIIHFAAYFYAVSVVFGTQCALPYLVILIF